MSFLRRKSILDISLKNKRVLLRVDFNVPLLENKIANNQRIVAAVPTIRHLLENEVKAIFLVSHLGNPNGQRNEKFSLKVIVEELQKILDRDVVFVNECMGPDVESACSDPDYGSVILLENLRFHVEEEGQIEEEGRKIRVETSALRIFRDSLSKLGDVYVNDALTSSHRHHSSITGIAIETRVSGLLMKKELESFARLFDKPSTPFLAIFGGSRIADKINMMEYLLEKVTDLIVVGGPAFTFLRVIQKMEIGKSLFDEEGARSVPRLMERAKVNKVNVLLPVDFVTADRFEEKALVGRSKIKDGIRGDHMGLDIGQETVKKFQPVIMKAKTVVWNGPPGVFEWENFSKGTEALVALLASATKKGTFTLLGGEDTALAAEKFKATNKFSHVSTGGEATLELLEGKELPGIVHLTPVDPNQMKI